MSVTLRAMRAAFLLVMLAGCAPEPSGARERLCAGNGCTDECRDLRVEACDIRERACQDVIFASLQCVRGRVLDETPYVKFVDELMSGNGNRSEALDRPANPTNGSTSTQSTPPRPNTTQEQLAQQIFSYYVDEGVRLLRLIDQATTIVQANDEQHVDVGAIESDGGVKVEHGSAGYRWSSMLLVTHEFVHAQQEVDYGGIANLFNRYPRTSKSRQSLLALLEGEAELYAWLTHAFMRNTELEDWSLQEHWEDAAKVKRRDIAQDQSPWPNAQRWQHYAIGAKVLSARWQAGHNLAVRSVLHNLEPDFGAWARGLAPPSGADLGNAVIPEPSGMQMVVRDELGPSGVFALLMAASKTWKPRPVEPAWRLASALVDDKLDFFAPLLPEGETQSQRIADDTRAECEAKREMDGGIPSQPTADAGSDASAPEERDSSSDDCADVAQVGDEVASAAVPYGRLVPRGSVWLSWRMAFATPKNAQEFVAYFEQVNWPHLEVTHSGAKVLIKAQRKPKTDAEQAAFDAWQPWAAE